MTILFTRQELVREAKPVRLDVGGGKQLFNVVKEDGLWIWTAQRPRSGEDNIERFRDAWFQLPDDGGAGPCTAGTQGKGLIWLDGVGWMSCRFRCVAGEFECLVSMADEENTKLLGCEGPGDGAILLSRADNVHLSFARTAAGWEMQPNQEVTAKVRWVNNGAKRPGDGLILQLALDKVRCADKQVSQIFVPKTPDGTLPVEPCLLRKESPPDLQTNPPYCGLRLANGVLVVSRPTQAKDEAYTLSWNPHAGSETTLALITALRDGRGLPLAVEFRNEPLFLTFRSLTAEVTAFVRGLSLTAPPGAGTRRALTVAFKSIRDVLLRDSQYPCTVVSLAWEETSGGNDWQVQSHKAHTYTYATINASARAPGRVRGFARNSWISLAAKAPAPAMEAQLHVCELCTNSAIPVTVGTANTIALTVPAGAEWKLNVLFDEEDFAGKLFAGAAGSGVSKLDRLTSAAARGSVRLPVTDLGASISHTNLDVDRWLTHWNHKLDQDLVQTFKTLDLGQQTEPLHAAAGFQRRAPIPRRIVSVLGTLRAAAASGGALSPPRSPIETRPSRPELLAASALDNGPAAAWLDRKLARSGYLAQLVRLAMPAAAAKSRKHPAAFDFGELADGAASAPESVKRALLERVDWLEVVLFGRPENLGAQYADGSEWATALKSARAVEADLRDLREALLQTTCTCEGSLPLAPDFARMLKLLALMANSQLAKSLQDGTLWQELQAPVINGKRVLFSSAEQFEQWWSVAKGTALGELRILAQQALGQDPRENAPPTTSLQELLASLQRAAWWWREYWAKEWPALNVYLTKLKGALKSENLELARADVAVVTRLLRNPKSFDDPWPPTYFGANSQVKDLPDNVTFKLPGLSGLLLSRTPSLETVLRTANLIGRFDARTKPNIVECLKYLAGIEHVIEDSRTTLLQIVTRPGVEQIADELRKRWEGEAEQLLQDIKQRAEQVVYQQVETLIRQCPRLDEQTLAKIRGLSDDARIALAAVLDLTKSAPEAGAALLHELGNAPADYVAIGRRVHVALSEAVVGGYTAVRQQIDAMTALVGQPITLCALGTDNTWDFVAAEGSVFILKLSKRRSLEQILTELHERFASADDADPLGLVREFPDPKLKIAAKARRWVADYVDPAVASSDWQGLFVLRPMVDLGGDQVTRDLAGVRQIEMKYAALCGPVLKAANQQSRDTFDLWARVKMDADDSALRSDGFPKTEERDAVLTLLRFDAHIRNSRLLPKSRIDLRLDVGRMFGKVTVDRESARLDIYGRIVEPERPGDATRFEFATEMTQPRKLDLGVMFFKEIWIQRVAAAFRNGHTALEIDAKLTLQSSGGGTPFPFTGDGGHILLQDFRLLMPTSGDSQVGVPRGLRFDFGALSGVLSSPRALTLGMLKFEVWELGYVRRHRGDEQDSSPDPRVKADSQRLERRFRPITGPAIAGVTSMPYVVFRVTFGGLPGLDRAANSKVSVYLLVGQDHKGGLIVAAGDLDARDIRLTVFRALEIYIGQMFFRHDVPGASRNYSALYVNDFRLSILGWSLIGDQDADECDGTQATLLHLQDESGESGFATFCKPRSFPLIDVDWILLGRNLKLAAPSYQQFLLAEQDAQAAGSCINDTFVDMHYPAGSAPVLNKIKADLAGNGAWLFGIAFQLGGSLLKDCALVLQDGVYYGIRLRGELIKQLFDDSDVLAVAYQPGKTASQDRFYLSTRIPLLDLLGAAGGFNSGWVTIGWSFNSDALLGLGFPFREGARYRWDQSFSCYQGVYQAHFGFYVEKRSSLLKRAEDKLQLVELRGGLAVEFGYGVNLGGGWLYIRAGIGVFVIVEGSLTVALPASGQSLLDLDGGLYGFSFNGVIGVLAYVEGYINVWIISARFRADLQASLAVAVEYTKGKPILISYDATLYAGYYAKACIDCGIDEICMTVKGSYPVRVSGQTKI